MLGAWLMRGKPLARPLTIIGTVFVGFAAFILWQISGITDRGIVVTLFTPALAWRIASVPLLLASACAVSAGTFVLLSPLTAGKRPIGWLLAGAGLVGVVALIAVAVAR